MRHSVKKKKPVASQDWTIVWLESLLNLMELNLMSETWQVPSPRGCLRAVDRHLHQSYPQLDSVKREQADRLPTS